MQSRLLALFAVVAITAGWGELPSVATGGAPDNPGARAPKTRYAPVMTGTKNYQPVEPLPWGEANRRVAPPKPPVKPAK